MNILTVQFSTTLFYVFPLIIKHFLQHPVLEHPQCSSLYVADCNVSSMQISRKNYSLRNCNLYTINRRKDKNFWDEKK